MKAIDFIRGLGRAVNVCDGKGVDCYYHNYDDRIGVKYYRDEQIGELTFGLQVIMNEIGLAPRCWGYSHDDKGVAYYTERVEVGYAFTWNEVQSTNMALNSTGFINDDSGGKNVGKTDDGRIVIIDFGFVKQRKDPNEFRFKINSLRDILAVY